MSSTPTDPTDPRPAGGTPPRPGDLPEDLVTEIDDDAPVHDELPPELREDDDLDDDDFDDDEDYVAGDLDDGLLVVRPRDEASLPTRLGVEALGTFALVVVITGVALYGPISGVGAVGVALAAGLVLVGVTAAFAHLSGGHFNPAVTLGAAIAGRTRWADLPLYWLAQVLGAVAAGATVFLTIPQTLPSALQIADAPTFFASTANSWGEASQLWLASQELTSFNQNSAFVIELIAGALLTAVVLGTAHRDRTGTTAPYAVGLTYAALILLAGPITGGSANPARSTGTALFAGSVPLGQLWLFWVAPLLGGALVGLAAYGFGRRDEELAISDDEVLVVERA